jgi:hypothetical protein
LKYRVAYTPGWTDNNLSSGPYQISPDEIGKQPSPSDLPQNSEQGREISEQFHKCIGDDGDRAGDDPETIRKRGEKIRRLIGLAINRAEMGLMEWPTLKSLPDSNPARRLIETHVARELCTSPKYKDDVYDLFVALRRSVKKPNEASFSNSFLKSHPHLDDFLKEVCLKQFREMELPDLE